MATKEPRAKRDPSLLDALIPMLSMVVLISGSLAIFGLDALDGPIQVALVAACLIAATIALKNSYAWNDVQAAGQSAMASITSAVFILLAVGALTGTWNMSGTIPTLVYYGIQVPASGYFHVATALICGIVALVIGSSWTTAGTIGVGLIWVAAMLGVNPAIPAGAVISGAYLGDKLSPLSETTILTAQMEKVDFMKHIKAQVWTSVPAFMIALIIFTVLGFTTSGSVDPPASASVELTKLDQAYNITPWNLLPLALLVILSIKKVPASMALFVSALFVGITGAIWQSGVLEKFVGADGFNLLTGVRAMWLATANGFSTATGIEEIDRLLLRGGMDLMLLTLWLIIGTVTFGALMDELGLIRRLTDPLIEQAQSRGSLYLAVFALAFGLNVVAGGQYIMLVLPTRIFRAEFEKRELAPTNLSRLAAETGTVMSALVPWNSCGAFMGPTLGVSALQYLPFAFFNYLSPPLSVVYGFSGGKVVKLTEDEIAAAKEGSEC